MLADKDQLAVYRSNCTEAAKVLNWENEKQKLIEILENYV